MKGYQILSVMGRMRVLLVQAEAALSSNMPAAVYDRLTLALRECEETEHEVVEEANAELEEAETSL